MKAVSIKDLLPIGSIVKLKKVNIKVMISGVFPKDNETGKVFDYFGVSYPFGYVSDKTNIVFQASAIDEIIFRGYEDEYRNELVQFISQNDKYKQLIHSIEEVRNNEG